MSVDIKEQWKRAQNALNQEDIQSARVLLDGIVTNEATPTRISALARASLAGLLMLSEEEDEAALALATQAVEICQVHGIDDLAEPYNTLASILVAFGLPMEQPLELWEHVLRVLSKDQGPRSVDAAFVLLDIGIARRIHGQFEASVEALEESHAILAHANGPMDLDAVVARLHLLESIDRSGKPDVAYEHIQALLEQVKHPTTRDLSVWSTALGLIAQGFSEQGRYAESDEVYAQLESVASEELKPWVVQRRAENIAKQRSGEDAAKQWAKEERDSIEQWKEDSQG